MSRSPIPSTRLSPIGLDVGFGEVRAVQMARGEAGDSLVCSAVFPRPSGPRPLAEFDGEEASALASVLGRRGFVGRRITVAAPHEACTAYTLELPPRDSGAPVQEIARAEIARKSRVPGAKFELATWYLPGRGRSERGMAVACENGALSDYLSSFDRAGLVPVAVDLQECALARACDRALGAEDESIHAMILVGWSTTLAVLTIGRSVVYTRRFDIGVGPGVERLRESAGLSWGDAARVLDSSDGAGDEPGVFERCARTLWSELGERLAEEADTAVTYVTHAHRTSPVGRVLIAGYGAGRPEVLGTIDEVLGMPVSAAGDPDAAAACAGADAARTAVAAGLAARFDT